MLVPLGVPLGWFGLLLWYKVPSVSASKLNAARVQAFLGWAAQQCISTTTLDIQALLAARYSDFDKIPIFQVHRLLDAFPVGNRGRAEEHSMPLDEMTLREKIQFSTPRSDPASTNEPPTTAQTAGTQGTQRSNEEVMHIC